MVSGTWKYHTPRMFRFLNLPLEENRIMIYTDLGVYTGQRLGTPCDDLL